MNPFLFNSNILMTKSRFLIDKFEHILQRFFIKNYYYKF